MRQAIPSWSPEDIEAMKARAKRHAQDRIDRRWPDTPENALSRKVAFAFFEHEEFRKLSDPNWPQ